MKATKFFPGVALLAGLMTAGLLAEDAAKAAAPKSDDTTFTFVDPADPAVADIVKTGSRAIDSVGTKLVNETTNELAAKDTQQVVAVLHLKNLQLPKSPAGAPQITAVRRTSLHIRNPANKPDAADHAALIKISDQLTDEGKAAKVLVQKIEKDGKLVEWRVTRPIAVSKSCLACHGDPSKFAPGVKEALDQQYPMDQATDYSAQSWRGVIRVSVAPVAK